MNNHQSVFELWNYTFLFMTLSTLSAFTVDIIGHRTRTISSTAFTFTVLAGISISELVMNYAPDSNFNLKLAIAILLSIIISVLIPLKFRTIDPETPKKVIRENTASKL